MVLRKSGLPLTLWSSGKGMVTTEQFFAIWRSVGELSDDSRIGLRLPDLVPREQHHPMNIAAQHARTFRDAAFASVLELGRRGTQQPLHPLRVELKRNPAHSEIYESYYGCRVRFKARRNAILFRTADLDRPFVTYNAELLAMLGPQLDRELAERKAGQTISVPGKMGPVTSPRRASSRDSRGRKRSGPKHSDVAASDHRGRHLLPPTREGRSA